jgi:predicted nucleotidyltransferase
MGMVQPRSHGPLQEHQHAIRALAMRHRASNPRLFGSVLHGRAREESDIDILVDALPGATLFDLGALQVELEDLLGRRVDLLTPGDISPRFRERVLAEARAI